MEANGLIDGTGEAIPGHRLLEGTDLEIAYNLQGDELVLRVNKGGVLVFRTTLRDAALDMPEEQLMNFNSFAPDFMFTVGDSEEGLQRMLASAAAWPSPLMSRRRSAASSVGSWDAEVLPCKIWKHLWPQQLTSPAWTSVSFLPCAGRSTSGSARCAKRRGLLSVSASSKRRLRSA